MEDGEEGAVNYWEELEFGLKIKNGVKIETN